MMRLLATIGLLVGALALSSNTGCSKGNSKEIAAAAEADKNAPVPKEALLLLKFHHDT